MSNLVDPKAIWYTTAAGIIIGIVEATDSITGEVKKYIGIGAGRNEKEDIAYILQSGAKFRGTIE